MKSVLNLCHHHSYKPGGNTIQVKGRLQNWALLLCFPLLGFGIGLKPVMHRRGFRGLLPGNDPNLSEKILIQKWEIVSFSPRGVEWSRVEQWYSGGRKGRKQRLPSPH